MTGPDLPLLLPVREAAKVLGLGRDSTYELVRSGDLRSIRIGVRSLIPRSELEAWVARELGGEAIDVAADRADATQPQT